MPGPLPKAERQRARDTRRRAAEYVPVERDGYLRGPSLAEATGRAEWPAEVVRWWDAWRAAPQAALFEVTDWNRLALLAVLVEGYYRRPTAAALSEIRMNEERLGATWGDRLRNRIRVIEAGEDDATVTPLRAVPAGNDVAALFGDEEDAEEDE